jgi:hypothetical protein
MVAVVLAGAAACGGGEDGRVAGTTVVMTVAPVDQATVAVLGASYAMDIEPAVVPGVAEPDLTISNGANITYRLPEGTQVDAVHAWYEQNMTPGADYFGLVWLKSEVDPQRRWIDHYWCRDFGEVLFVTVGQDLPGSSWVMIGLAPAGEDDCRATPKREFKPFVRFR